MLCYEKLMDEMRR